MASNDKRRLQDATSLRLLRVDEVAEIISTSKRSVWTLISSGRLPVIRIGKRMTRVLERDLLDFIQERRSS